MNELDFVPVAEGVTAAATTFGLIFLAEMGDKSQIVCMALAARHRHWPVLLGSVAAFIVLNTLAVVFGAALAQWVPEKVLAALVAGLFAVFGVLSLRAEAEDDDEEVTERGGHNIFIITFLMILLAEMGDKTQLAVAAMAGTLPPIPVWLGATSALTATSAIGVVAGCKLLKRIPLHRIHQVSGAIFLILAAYALTRVF